MIADRILTRLTTKLSNGITRSFVGTQHCDGILMDCLELGVIFDLALQIHLLEHVERGLFPGITKTRAALGLNRSAQLPAIKTTLEPESLAVISGGNDLSLAIPDEAHKGEQLGVDGDNSPGRLLRGAWIHNSDAAVMRGKGKSISAGGESHRVNPTSRVVQVLATDGVEGQSLTPGGGLWPGVDALDEAGQDTRMGIGRASGKKDRVGMPCDSGDGTANRLLQVLRDPPVIFLLEIADRDQSVTRSNRKLGLVRRPAYKGGSSVDAQEDEGRLIALGGRFPHEGIAICA